MKKGDTVKITQISYLYGKEAKVIKVEDPIVYLEINGNPLVLLKKEVNGN
jgi:hypothetical protein